MAELLIEDYISHIKTTLNHGSKSDDSPFSDRYIYSILRMMRAELIKNKSNKSNFLNTFNYQTIPCLSLEIVHGLDDCECLPDGVGCQYARTILPIPEILSSRDRLLVRSVRDAVGNIIDQTTYETSYYDTYSKIKKERTRYFIHNSYLYITANNTDLSQVSITALFFDPTDLASIPTCTDSTVNCYEPLKQPFPMEKDLSSALFKMTFDEIFTYAMRVPQDLTNDAQSGTPIEQ